MTILGKHVTNNGERKTSWWRRTKGVIQSECKGSATVMRKTGKASAWTNVKDLLPWWGKTVRRHQSNSFFTLRHHPVSCLSTTVFLPPFRMTILGKRVIINGEQKTAWWRRPKDIAQSDSKESAAVVRETGRCHQSNRFFALFHCSASLLSHTAFLLPLWMTGYGKAS